MRLNQIAVLLLSLHIFISCVGISSNDTVSWQVNYTLPLLKERITVSMLDLRSQNIIDDSTRSGDTLFITLKDTMKHTYQSTVFSLPLINDTWYTGSLVLNRLNKVESTMPAPSSNKQNIIDTITKDSVTELVILCKDSVYLGPVSEIDFGKTDKNTTVMVKNISKYTDAYDVQYTLITRNDTLIFNTIPSLSPGDSVAMQIPLNGIAIGPSVIVECRSSIGSEMAEEENSILSFMVDFNGLQFSTGTMSDSLLSLHFSYDISHPFGLKAFNASYIDISSFYFPFTIRNTVPVALELNAIIADVWSKDYCSNNGIKELHGLSAFTPDSQYFKGNEFIALAIPASDTGACTLSEHTIHFNNARFFPGWNPADTINMIHMLINGTLKPSGKLVYIDNIDSAGIKLEMPGMDISSIYGAYVAEARIGSVPVKQPLLSDTQSIDLATNLKNRLIPEKTDVTIKIQFQLPDSTSFEAIELSCALFETDPETILDSVIFEMNDIKAGKGFSFNNSFNQILKKLPDSLGYFLTYIIKPGRSILLDDEVLFYDNGTLQTRFDTDIALDMTMFFVWNVIDTVSISFKRKIESFPISSKSIELLNNKEMVLSVLLSNNSNIIGRLRAAIENVPALNTISNTYQTQLLGINGLSLPSRGKSAESFISFNQAEIKNLASPDSLDINWIIDLFPCDIDALKDTDYLEIDAEMVLKGEQSIESTFDYR